MSTDGNRRLWRVAGVLAIAHVVLMFGSFSLQKVADLGAKPSSVVAAFANFSLAKGYVGAYLTLSSFLVFLLAATLLARLLQDGTALSAWLSSTIVASGTIYVAVTFASVHPVLGAALYDAHHGMPLSVVTALDHVHWFAVFGATMVLGVFTMGVACAALSAGALPRWLGFAGVPVGVLCLASGAGAQTGLVGAATLLWSVWFVLLAVAALRTARAATSPILAASSLAG